MCTVPLMACKEQILPAALGRGKLCGFPGQILRAVIALSLGEASYMSHLNAGPAKRHRRQGDEDV